MISVKNIMLLILMMGATAFIPSDRNLIPSRIKWVIFKNCTLKIEGSTNINKFSCSIPAYSSPDTLICVKGNDKDLPVVMSGGIDLPVLSFDCMNVVMTNDLRKTLKAKEFPSLSIRFLSLEKYPQLKSSQESIAGAVSIELAGVAKKIIVNYRISMDDQKVIHLIGNQTVQFSDFHIIPPSKLGGMIRAKDQLQVEFHINFRTI